SLKVEEDDVAPPLALPNRSDDPTSPAQPFGLADPGERPRYAVLAAPGRSDDVDLQPGVCPAKERDAAAVGRPGRVAAPSSRRQSTNPAAGDVDDIELHHAGSVALDRDVIAVRRPRGVTVEPRTARESGDLPRREVRDVHLEVACAVALERQAAAVRRPRRRLVGEPGLDERASARAVRRGEQDV